MVQNLTNEKTRDGSNATGQDSHTNGPKNSRKSPEINGYIDQILEHAERGWPVFPCNSDKHPLIETGFHAASTDPVKIRSWWQRWPDALVAIPTGDVSKIWVLDIDCKNGVNGSETLEAMIEEHGFIPDTFRVQTRSGGFHLYFKNVEGLRNSAGKIGHGIDVRAQGGYVICPPSAGYSVTRDAPIIDAPQWLIAQAMANKVPAQTTELTTLRDNKPQANDTERAGLYLAKMPESIAGNGGHNALLAAASAMVNGFCLGETDAFDLLKNHFNGRCIPIWSDKELLHKIHEAQSKPPSKPMGWLLNAETQEVVSKPRRRREVPLPTSEDLMAQTESLIGIVAEADPRHAEMVVAILESMDRRGLAADATGALRWKSSRELAAVDLGGFCRAIAFDLRRRGPVNLGTVIETAEEMLHRDAQKRRQEILATMLGKPSSAAGMAELRKWVYAVTNSVKEADVQAVAHWLWCVKRKQSGGHAERHLMITLYGPQESGKSRAAQAIIEPWAELADQKMEAASLTDERCRPALAHRAIGLLDELSGLTRADAAELKATITADEIGYRPMRSNDRRVLPMMMSFIGTSNKSIAELVHDTSGARRFYELQTPAKCDWQAINAVNYSLLWEAASENDQAPGIIHRQIIAAEQCRLVWQDPVQRWLADETDVGWQSCSGLDGVLIPKIEPVEGAATATLYRRLQAWCVAAGEREPTRETMGRRLSELEWEAFKLPRSQERARGYRQLMKVPLSTRTTWTTDTPGAGGPGGDPQNHKIVFDMEAVQ